MGRPKKDLQASAIWRSEVVEEEDDSYGNLFASPNDSNYLTINIHDSKNKIKKKVSEDEYKDFSSRTTKFDSQLSYTFRRNYQFLQNVFSIDTIVKPLPPAMAENVACNLSFFRRIFTQFFEPDGISNAQKAIGFGRENKFREVR